jgi:hypothetical protein
MPNSQDLPPVFAREPARRRTVGHTTIIVASTPRNRPDMPHEVRNPAEIR